MSIDLEKHRPLARLLLRVLGVYFIIVGATGVVGYGLAVFWDFRAHQSLDIEYFAGHDMGWLIGSVVELLAGLYLTFKGRLAMDAIFHEAIDKPAVPCPDCGFDLRGNPEATHCPECGSSLNRPDSP